VLRTEFLQDEYHSMMQTLGEATGFLHAHHTQHGACSLTTDDLDKTSKAMLYETYRLDFECLGYSPNSTERSGVRPIVAKGR